MAAILQYKNSGYMTVWIVALVCLVLGCCFFEKQAERTFGVDIHRQTALLHDAEYLPLPSRWLQLAQLGLLFGTESFFGIIVGLLYGPITMAWCVIGTSFFGAGLVYYSGMYAVSTGKTLNSLILKFFGKRVYQLLTGGLCLFVCLDICSKFVFLFNVNHSVFGYSLWFLVFLAVLLLSFLSPRNFVKLCAFTAVMILFSSAYFLLASITQIEKLPADFNPWSLRELKFAYPFLFFTVSAGAISGSQALKSIIVAPFIKNEKIGTGVFWRTMFVHTGIIILWNLMILSWNPTREFIISLLTGGANIYETMTVNMASHIFLGRILQYVTCLLIGITSIIGLMRALADILLETKEYPVTALYIIQVSILVLCALIYPLALSYSFAAMNTLVITIYFLFLLMVYLKSVRQSAKKYKFMLLFLIGVMVAEFVLQIYKKDLLQSVASGVLVSLIAYILIDYKEFLSFVKNINHNYKRHQVLKRQKKQAAAEKRLLKQQKAAELKQQQMAAQAKENALIKAMSAPITPKETPPAETKENKIAAMSAKATDAPLAEVKVDTAKPKKKRKKKKALLADNN